MPLEIERVPTVDTAKLYNLEIIKPLKVTQVVNRKWKQLKKMTIFIKSIIEMFCEIVPSQQNN